MNPKSPSDFPTSFTGSILVKVHGSAGTADDAAELVGTMMEVFWEYQAECQKSRLEAELTNIDERLSAIRTNLATAREAYDAFREEHGISDLTREQRQEIESATKARTDADVATGPASSIISAASRAIPLSDPEGDTRIDRGDSCSCVGRTT